MNSKLKLGLAAALVYCVGTVAAFAQEDSVYVNLSVLDSLDGPAVNGPIPSEALFPVVKKAPVIKKKTIKKPKPVAAPVKVDVKETAAPVVEVKVEELPAPVVAETKPEPQQIPYVENVEPIVVVDVEPAAPAVVQPIPAPIVEAAPAVVPVVVPTVPVTVSAPEPSALLIDETAPTLPQPGASGKLTFAEGVDELSAEQQAQVDAIIASFADATNNKIAIYSYNLDDGVDTFKKKRLSLNRAVNVRSYLLPKGYKNFSIKVVNVDAAAGKNNVVELEELR